MYSIKPIKETEIITMNPDPDTGKVYTDITIPLPFSPSNTVPSETCPLNVLNFIKLFTDICGLHAKQGWKYYIGYMGLKRTSQLISSIYSNKFHKFQKTIVI